ncbi:MAG: DoxX family protein [Thermoanaerobaculia bacterium]
MNTFATRFTALSPYIHGLTRFIVGALFATHGAQKLFGAFGGIPPGTPAWIVYGAGTIEFFGGILIAIGLFTRTASFIASGSMAVAYFYGHVYLAQTKSFWPNVNGGEPAVLFCWIFLLFAASGPGALALDHVIRRQK